MINKTIEYIAALFLVVAASLTYAAPPPANDAAKKPPQPAAHGPTLESSIEAAQAATIKKSTD